MNLEVKGIRSSEINWYFCLDETSVGDRMMRDSDDKLTFDYVINLQG